MEKHWPTPDNVICNLCQQAGEKFLKGYLVSKEINFEKIHNLVILLKLCENAESEFTALQDKCSYLTPFAVIPRYSYEQQLNQDDAKVAIQYAKDIQQFIKKTLKPEFQLAKAEGEWLTEDGIKVAERKT
ncbi:hypothetical protein FACS1894147_02250 [Spirochaetia bacterium]|nr:hypothetical protein FACS1894147_02250 [Spirochaetia bacterium]